MVAKPSTGRAFAEEYKTTLRHGDETIQIFRSQQEAVEWLDLADQ